MAPAEAVEFGDVEEFAGGAVGFGEIVIDITFEAGDAGDEVGQVDDGQILAGADIDQAGLVVVFHEVEGGVGQVIDVEELAAGPAGTPEDDLLVAVALRFVKLADQGGQYMGGLEVVIVVGAVEVGGHDGNEMAAVLGSVGVAELDAGDLGDGVGFIGGLQLAGEEVVFFQRLRRQLGVDTGGAQEEELFDAILLGGMDDVVLDHQVVIEEFSPVGVVGHDAAYLGRSEEYIIGLLPPEELLYLRLAAQVELPGSAGDEVIIAFSLQLAEEGGAYHAAVAGYVDFIGWIHTEYTDLSGFGIVHPDFSSKTKGRLFDFFENQIYKVLRYSEVLSLNAIKDVFRNYNFRHF